MKFVKGDAIAGIIITLINIIGGLIIGTTMNGMDTADAAKTYALLSIGDGLISQIPALLISITAGIVTTRVSSERSENLGSEISSQVLKQPKALMVAAGFLMGMSLVPGFPMPPFLILSAALGLIGYALWSRDQKEGTNLSAGGTTLQSASDSGASIDTSVRGHKVVSGGGVDNYALTLPVVLEVGKGLSTEVQKSSKSGASFIDQMVPKMRQALYADLGVRFPGVHVRTDSPILDKDEYSIHLNEVPIIRGKVIEGHLLTNETEENLKRYNLSFASYKKFFGPPLFMD